VKEDLTVADYIYSVKIGSVIGFLAGWAIGIALLLYLDSKALNSWPGVPSIPLLNGLGWMLYGLIAGGSGMFANLGRKRDEVPGNVTLSRKEGAQRIGRRMPHIHGI
jgi:tetrahydromethanopterin S-methyltransferase subunit G